MALDLRTAIANAYRAGQGGQGQPAANDRGRNISQLQAELRDKLDPLNEELRNLRLEITPQDRELIEQSIGASADIARRELDATLPQILARINANVGARGFAPGSSIEAANRSIAGGEAIRSIADLLSREQQQGAQALLQMPFLRHEAQMSQNRQLFDQILGAIRPRLETQMQLQQREIDTNLEKRQQNMDLIKGGVKTAARIGAGYLTGGASEIGYQAAGAYDRYNTGGSGPM